MSPNRRSSPDRDETLFQSSSATTSIQGVFRWLTVEDYQNTFTGGTKLSLINGTSASLSDYGVGPIVSIFSAQDGDQWVFKFILPDGTFTTDTMTFRSSFLGQRDCFTFGIFGPTACGTGGSIDVADAAFVKCTQLGRWEIDLTFNNNIIFLQAFDLISAGPAASVQLSPNVITPQTVGGGGIPNIDPGITNVTVAVTDSGCSNIPISGAAVNLSSRTVAGSGGHAHLVEQAGTGKFSASTGTTDRNGILTDITYTAGQVGLEENINAEARTPQGVTEGSSRLTIRYDTLQELPSLPLVYQLTGGTVRHPLNNNHFGTADTNSKVTALAQIYMVLSRGFTTGLLGINDMSLPFGGVFDLNGQLNVAGGHVSHKTGIDTDVNTADTVGRAVNRDLLTRIACGLRGRPIREASIHYRFDGQSCR